MRYATMMTGGVTALMVAAALWTVSLATGCATDSASDAGTDSDTGPLICDKGIWTGDYTVNNASDMEGIAGYTEIAADDGNHASLMIEILDDSLTDLSALGCLTSVERNLRIVNNDSITSLYGLNALTEVGDDISVNNNPALPDLEGLNSLTSVTNILSVDSNTGLNSLEGLNSLTSVGVDVRINNNNALTDLDGLSSLISIGHGLFVTDNALLSDCEVCDLLDQLDSGPDPEAINVYENLSDDCTPVPDNCP